MLGKDCTWRQQGLPRNVLASLTRHFESPTAGGKGAMRLSAAGTMHRTPLDAAWEQARTGGGEVGPASDVFSLGCVPAYATAGRRPFGTGDPAAHATTSLPAAGPPRLTTPSV